MDVVLTEGRVCQQCAWTWQSADQVVLTDNHRHTTMMVPRSEVLGIQRHPWVQKLFVHAIQNQGIDGLPGRIIVPQAFDDETGWLPQMNGLPSSGR